MSRTFGARDTKPRKRRKTKQEIAEERKTQVSEHIRKIREKEKTRIEQEYYLVPKELLDMTGISLERLKKLLCDNARLRINEALKRLEEIEKEWWLINKVFITGRITKDLELRETKTGKKVCEFTIATNRVNGKEADFVNCMVWDKQAENLVKYQGKGSLLGIEGSIRTETYELSDKKHYKTFVLVNNIEYLSQTQKTENTPKNDFESASIKTEFHDQLEITEDDYPF